MVTENDAIEILSKAPGEDRQMRNFIKNIHCVEKVQGIEKKIKQVCSFTTFTVGGGSRSVS